MVELCGIALIVVILFVCCGVLFNFVWRTFFPPPIEIPGAEVPEDHEYNRKVQQLLGRIK